MVVLHAATFVQSSQLSVGYLVLTICCRTSIMWGYTFMRIHTSSNSHNFLSSVRSTDWLCNVVDEFVKLQMGMQILKLKQHA